MAINYKELRPPTNCSRDLICDSEKQKQHPTTRNQLSMVLYPYLCISLNSLLSKLVLFPKKYCQMKHFSL